MIARRCGVGAVGGLPTRVCSHGHCGASPRQKKNIVQCAHGVRSLNTPRHAQFEYEGPPLSSSASLFSHLPVACSRSRHHTRLARREASFGMVRDHATPCREIP